MRNTHQLEVDDETSNNINLPQKNASESPNYLEDLTSLADSILKDARVQKTEGVCTIPVRPPRVRRGLSKVALLPTPRLVDPKGTKLGPRFNALSEKYLSLLNQSPNIIYTNDLPQSVKKPKRALKEQGIALKKLGVSREVSNRVSFTYLPRENISDTLDALLELPLFTLDCREALDLAELLALRDLLGKGRFQEAMEALCPKRVCLSDVMQLHSVHHYVTPPLGGKVNRSALDQVQPGECVYILGPANGFALKPSSEYNGYNLLCTRIDDQGNPLFKGFQSHDDMELSFQDLESLMLEKFHHPLTSEDLSIIISGAIQSPKKRALFSTLTYEGVTELLEMYLPRYKSETLPFPKELTCDKIVGITHSWRIDEKTLQRLAQGLPIRETQSSFTPMAFEAEVEEDQLQLGFELNELHQRQLYHVAKSFYETCLDEKKKDLFGGVILYGDPGTGKTHLCKGVVNLLAKQEGKKVWQVEYGQEVLSLEQFRASLQLLQNDGREARLGYLISLFEDEWKDVDVFYFDDSNQASSKLGVVCSAALEFARANGRKILINSNASPFETFTCGEIRLPVDDLHIHQVNGPDYRLKQSWWLKDFEVLPSTLTEIEPSQPLTPAQEKIAKEFAILESFSEPQGAGLFISGAPGLGKSTVLRKLLENHKHLWINSANGPQYRNLADLVAESDVEYVLIDDVNKVDGLTDFAYGSIFKQIANSTGFQNAHGKFVKIIMVTNECIPSKLIQKCACVLDEPLRPRMTSRFQSLFHQVKLETAVDLRSQLKTEERPGRLAPLDSFDYSSWREQHRNAFVLNTAEWNDTLHVLCQAERWSEQEDFRNKVMDQMRQAPAIAIEWKETLDFAGQNDIWTLLLDLMSSESKPVMLAYQGTREVFEKELKSFTDQMSDTTGKFQSRLKLFD